jgi:predicted nucleic acid-binding protein
VNDVALQRRVLVDAGPLVAIFRERGHHHHECVNILSGIAPPLLTSWPVITEAAFLLRDSAQAVERLLAGSAQGLYRIMPLAEDELPALSGLLRKYRRLGIQLADATLVHLAQRENLETVFTLDRRDFSVLRGRANRPFRLLPDH